VCHAAHVSTVIAEAVAVTARRYGGADVRGADARWEEYVGTRIRPVCLCSDGEANADDHQCNSSHTHG
jgi:hypothetical protein